MDDSIKGMSNEKYVEFLNTINDLPDEYREIIRSGVLQLNDDKKELFRCISDLQQENERLKEQNNDLRKTYRNTYNKLFENGNDELARYFQAQIDDCPTFYVEPIIDYHKEWLDYKSRCEKAIEYINDLRDESAERQGFYNCFPDDLYISNIEKLLNILQNGSDKEC